MADAPPSKKPINTQRLVLREARLSDLAAIHELYSNKDVMRYWSHPHDCLTRTEFYLENMVKSSTNGEIAFILVLHPSASTTTPSTTPAPTTTAEGKVIGHAGIWHADKKELVFMIGHSYWKQGYMTEVLAALVPMFWKKGLKKVYADVNPENKASLKVLRKYGFIKMGGNIIASFGGRCESLRMKLTNPNGGGEEEGDAGDGSNDSSGDNDRG